LIQKNDVSLANNMLGRIFEISGEKISGNRIGRTLGFPTINVNVDKDKILPKGVFVCSIADKTGRIFPGVLNIGIRPTVNIIKHNLSVEVHLLSFSGKWKEKKIKILLYKHIRNEKKFTNLNCLKKAVTKDINTARRFFSL
ncbi:MAG: riboflavin kinase, partial [Endomicrobiaceae bacterium]